MIVEHLLSGDYYFRRPTAPDNAQIKPETLRYIEKQSRLQDKLSSINSRFGWRDEIVDIERVIYQLSQVEEKIYGNQQSLDRFEKILNCPLSESRESWPQPEVITKQTEVDIPLKRNFRETIRHLRKNTTREGVWRLWNKTWDIHDYMCAKVSTHWMSALTVLIPIGILIGESSLLMSDIFWGYTALNIVARTGLNYARKNKEILMPTINPDLNKSERMRRSFLRASGVGIAWLAAKGLPSVESVGGDTVVAIGGGAEPDMGLLKQLPDEGDVVMYGSVKEEELFMQYKTESLKVPDSANLTLGHGHFEYSYSTFENAYKHKEDYKIAAMFTNCGFDNTTKDKESLYDKLKKHVEFPELLLVAMSMQESSGGVNVTREVPANNEYSYGHFHILLGGRFNNRPSTDVFMQMRKVQQHQQAMMVFFDKLRGYTENGFTFEDGLQAFNGMRADGKTPYADLILSIYDAILNRYQGQRVTA